MESGPRVEEANGIVLPPIFSPQTAPQGSKEGCLTLAYTLDSASQQQNRCAVTEKYGLNERMDQNPQMCMIIMIV